MMSSIELQKFPYSYSQFSVLCEKVMKCFISLILLSAVCNNCNGDVEARLGKARSIFRAMDKLVKSNIINQKGT